MQLKLTLIATAQEIVLLIKNEANVNRADWKGKNSLVYLCENFQNHQDESFVAMVNLWIEKGIVVNCKNKYGGNALTKMCEHNEHRRQSQDKRRIECTHFIVG
jgi:hypothetical protein